METMQETATWYIQTLSAEKLSSAVDYLRFLHEQERTPLDDFDYQLAREADEDTDTETVSMDDLLEKHGLTYADLQD